MLCPTHEIPDTLASSVTGNIAEGFGRYRHREFAQFLRIARGSLYELSEHLRDGIARGYWEVDTVTELDALSRRTAAALTRLIKYLLEHPDR
jgi:four helix bundle protein